MGQMKPLYGHTSEDSAYMVDDYPYGFRQRTRARFWLEHKPKHGWRFVSQTENPKTGRWNKPKASTYSEFAAAMYMDDDGHVAWCGIGQYSDEQAILSFVERFPDADVTILRMLVPAKQRFLQGSIDGTFYFTINGVKQVATEQDIARYQAERVTWDRIETLIGTHVPEARS